MRRDETKIVKQILKHLNRIDGARAVKVHGGPYSIAGEPDVDCVINGQSFKIEVKYPGEEPTKLQLKRLQMWREAGAVAEWVTSLDEVKKIIKPFIKEDK